MKLILMMAQTLDGRIGKNSRQNADWTTKADKKAFVAETKKHGVIIMGRTTFEAMGGRPLPNRLNLILSQQPEKYADKAQPGLLEFIKGTPQEVCDYLAAKNYQTAILGGGAKTNAMFLKAGVIDEILMTIEPKIFGIGLNFTEGEEFDLNLELLESKELGDNAVQIHYKIIK